MFATALSKDAQDALALLGKTRLLPKDTYLAGGSALALHYNHRISIDFDFFTPTHFVGKEIIQELNKVGVFELQETAERDTLLGLFNKVKFSLFLYEYPLILKPVLFLDVPIVSPEDIAAMKLSAVMDRGTKKDFIDLYFLSIKGVSVGKGFEYYETKYKALANNVYSLVKALAYFDDAEKMGMPDMIVKIDWEEIKEFFRKEAVSLAEKYLK
ncbi:hypothetical protein COY90_04440 [Candidatus Roizmanbacteria bacterium CG_4_10_14_0_8_um_filter_39_9]|uniref:Nucleotidyl transferase AbiEii/AbiGii toxin family protein n=1 Tax=Candidatus Roizmanbacteria bacterium CG_4_10_14_0_8_um_filter_39_9 TaxID=1974829 RepID=A0A2M7QCX0_9BACT|nr:MAG: hypothetical protein COY90_04440 [Candidatus Roizmanbacteria bacterium CG_4_10_14_0_8_um_filter_39_9]